jgi:hypothetical protein
VTDPTAFDVQPGDEGRHSPGPEQWWSESWYLDFVSEDGTLGGYVRLGLYPNQSVSWWTAAVVGPDREPVMAIDLQLPPPTTPVPPQPGGDTEVLVETDATAIACQIVDPLKAMRVVSSSPAGVYATAADVYRGAATAATRLDLDITWRTDGRAHHYDRTTRYEIPCLVEGSLAIGDETFTVAGPGQRDHSWAPRDWWSIDWCWFSGRLDDATRVHGAHIRVAPELVLSFGYRQDGDGTWVPIEDGLVVEETLGEEQLPTAGTIRCEPAGIDLAVEPLSYGPLLFVDPDGRVDRFPRAMARYTTPDGRTGLGWIEWNQVQRPT